MESNDITCTRQAGTDRASGSVTTRDVSRSARILLVDDEPLNIETLAGVLGSDYALSFATDGTDALRIASTTPRPELILLDIVMPGMDGFEVFARLRANTETAATPIIFLTALDDALNEARALQMGAVDYIHKPFNPAVVRARVRLHIKERRDVPGDSPSGG